jgi:3-oxoacyl-(acyl-carrier-protein) synthase
MNVDALAGNVRGSRSDKLAWIAAQEALASAGLASSLGVLDPERAGVLLGCTVGGMLGTEQFLARLLREQKRRFGPLRFHECAGAVDLCAQRLGARGPCATVSTACSAGAMAVAAAAELIEQGEADLVLAGGADSLCRLTLNGFGSLLLLDPNGCRPFDARRAGISLGEGAAMLVLEAEEPALARGSRILARLAGWGASCDAFHGTAPHPEGRGALEVMQRALARGGCQASETDYVSAHGTGTPDNDAIEARALRQLFGDQMPPVASVKRIFGHTLAASGAIQAVVCIQALREQGIPPNPGFEVADANLRLEPVKEFRAQRLSRVLSNSFGFGGNNVALVFGQADSPRSSRREEVLESGSDGVMECWSNAADTPISALRRSTSPKSRASIAVLGTGVVSAAGSALAEISAAFHRGGAPVALFDVPAAMPPGKARVYACCDFGADQFIEPARRRKLSRIQQMVLTAARRSMNDELAASIPSGRICAAVGTGLGSLTDTAAFVENLILKEERAPRPAFFANSVHNSLASQVAIELGLTGLNSTPIHREISFETALWQGAGEIALGHADLALVGAADELNSYALTTGMRWGWWNQATPEIRPFTEALRDGQRPLSGEGCTLFTLGRAGAVSRPLALVSAIRIGRCATAAGGRVDAAVEARWIQATLERDGISPRDVDLLLTGANGRRWLDGACLGVAEALSRLAGRSIPCGAYKQCCGEHHSASAFGFFTAVGLARGEIAPAGCLPPGQPASTAGPCRTIVLYTLSPTGTKGMCCVRA